MRITLSIVNIIISCSCVFCSIIETPQNLAVHVGQRMSLICRTSNGSKVREWLFTRSNDSSQIKKVFANWRDVKSPPPVDSGYGVDVDWFGSGEIYVNETQMENAGRYKCTTEKDGYLDDYYADLIVLGSKPVCNVTEYIHPRIKAECSVEFAGHWAPTMKWGNKDLPVTSVGLGRPPNNNTAISILEANAEKDSFALSCQVYFTPDKRADHSNVKNLATNVPEYSSIWKYNYFKDSDIADTTTGTVYTYMVTSLENLSNTSLRSDFSVRTSEETAKNEYFIYMLLVAALAVVFFFLMIGTLTYVIRRRKSKSANKKPIVEEEAKDKERALSGIYDTIEYDAIGYEMLDHVFSFDGHNTSYDLPVSERVPSGYEDPDKKFHPKDDKEIVLSSQYMTTFSDSDKGTTADISGTDRRSQSKENKYTSLCSDNSEIQDFGKQDSLGKARSSYLEIIGDAEELRTSKEPKTNRTASSSSEESEEKKNKISSSSANYTQLMPDTDYTHLVL